MLGPAAADERWASGAHRIPNHPEEEPTGRAGFDSRPVVTKRRGKYSVPAMPPTDRTAMTAGTESVEREMPSAATDTRIIDLDFHLNPDPEILLTYVEDETVAEKLTTEFGMAPLGGKWDAAYAINEGNEGLFTQGRAETAEDVHRAAAQYAIDDPIVNPGINNTPTQHHPVLKNAIARAANDYLLDRIVPADLDCLLMVPQWDPAEAAREIRRVGGETGIVGAYGWFGPFNLWGETEFDPVFEALVEHDLPLVLHGSLSFWPQNTPIGDQMLTWTEILGLDWVVHAQVTAANLVMSGVFDSFPELDVILEEGGHWWLPFARYRLDEFYEMHPEDVSIVPRKYREEEAYLDRRPSEYFGDNLYVTTQPMALPERSSDARHLLELSMAGEAFIYSSDWPHQTFDPATWAFDNPAIDEDLRNRILHENAAAVLGI